MVLVPIFLGSLAGWIFNQRGWEQASKSVAFSGLCYIYFTGAIGLVVGNCLFARLDHPPAKCANTVRRP